MLYTHIVKTLAMLAGHFASWAPPPSEPRYEQPRVPVRTAEPEEPKRERRLPQARPGPIVWTYHKPHQARASEKGTHGRLGPEAGQIGDGVDLMQPPPLPRRVPMGNDPGAARAAVTCTPPKPKASDKLKKCPTRRLQKLLK